MKKVGIVTLTGGENYGNALQNYAVQCLIEKKGYEAITLNNVTTNGFVDQIDKGQTLISKLKPSYVKDYIQCHAEGRYGCKNDRDFNIRNAAKLKNLEQKYTQLKASRKQKFAEFRKRCIHDDTVAISNVKYDKAHFDEFDAFVCGSDQVWNPTYRSVSMVEFLRFAPQHKRIALAPSFGVSTIPEARKSDYAKWLQEIPYLSVREDAGAEIVRNLTGRTAEVLFDPTFGLTASEWETFAREPKHRPLGKYVFCYFLENETKKYAKYIEKYASSHDYVIVRVLDMFDEDYYDIDPQEFVWLLMNAQAVFTDSFHGTAFAINMEKPFVVFERASGGKVMSSRLDTLLNKVKQNNRRFSNLSVDEIDNIQFDTTRELVEKERQRIHTYLDNALHGVEQANDKTQSPMLADRYNCTGCGACANACEKSALEMTFDDEGFRYPVINTDKCVNCKLCESACPVNRLDSTVVAGKTNIKAYYAFSKATEICANSSSGGIFTEIATQVISCGGVVYGVGFDNSWNVAHMRAETIGELNDLRTSKYVQSDTGSVYREVKTELLNGRTVLFTGTPCQVAALKAFLGKAYDNLITQDIICHGVPSPGLWNTYLDQDHRSKNITEISFRDKTQGWNAFSMKVRYADGTSYRKLATEDPYERAFLANLILRPSCHQCQFKTVSRCSDITLADYWGVEVVHPELKEQQGVSLVLVHSDKGQTLLGEIKDKLVLSETEIDIAISMNHGATHSVKAHRNRYQCFKSMQGRADFSSTVNILLEPTTEEKVKRFIIINGSRTKRFVKRVLKHT